MGPVLVVGCGDIGARIVPRLASRARVLALARDRAHLERLAVRGELEPLVADLDLPASLASLAGLANAVLHLAPPPDSGRVDSRTANLIDALSMVARPPARLVYVSTSGVYGDCGGAWVDETRALAPATDRAYRRVDAEQRLLEWGARRGVAVMILRVPGIYAADRLPTERLRSGTPALRDEDDVYTNHIHAEDLATIVLAALERGEPGRIYNAADDSAIKMGTYFDLVADRNRLARPARISRAEARTRLPPMLLSFMSESRRLVNQRIKRELAVRLVYPTVFEGVPDVAAGPHEPA